MAMRADGSWRRPAAQCHVHTSYTLRTRMHLLCFRSSPGAPALSRRAGRPFRSARLCPRVNSRCPVSRLTTGWSTGLYALARHRTSARLSSSAVHASPRAARGVQRRTTPCSMLPLGDGSENSFRSCFPGSLRKALSRRWNGYVLQRLPAVLIVPCRDSYFCHNRQVSWALPNSGIHLCVPV